MRVAVEVDGERVLTHALGAQSDPLVPGGTVGLADDEVGDSIGEVSDGRLRQLAVVSGRGKGKADVSIALGQERLESPDSPH